MSDKHSAALPHVGHTSGVPFEVETRGRARGSGPVGTPEVCPTWRRVATGLLTITLFTLATPAAAEDWGKLTLRFTFDGDAPTPEKLELNKDVDFCGPHDLRDESLLVDPKSKGIANVVVWLDDAKSGRAPAVHPSYDEALKKEVVVANTKCRFEPHVQAMRVGQTLRMTNEDEIAHSANVFFLKNPPVAYLVAPGGDDVRKDLRAELFPCPIKCPIHAWMSGYLLIKDHPYVAISNKDGTVTLANVPAGDWTFRVWHERVGYVDALRLDGERTKWKAGRFEVTIPANDTADLGVAEIDQDEFE